MDGLIIKSKLFKKSIIILMLTIIITMVPIQGYQEAHANALLLTLETVVSLPALPEILLGVAAICLVGAIIDNWDMIEYYGNQVWQLMTQKGVDPANYINTNDLSVTVTEQLIIASAEAVDLIPGILNVPNSVTTYQQWIGFPECPVALSVYPFQLINKDSSNVMHLVASQTQLYLPSGTLQNVGTSMLRVYDYDYVNATWLFRTEISSWAIGLDQTDALAKIVESNCSIYESSSLVSIKFTDTTIHSHDVTKESTFGNVASTVDERIDHAHTYVNTGDVIDLSPTQDLAGDTTEQIIAESESVITPPADATETGLLSGIKGLLQDICDAILAIPGQFMDLLQGIHDAVLNIPDLLTNIWQGILDIPDDLANIWQGILDIPGDILDKLKEVAEWLFVPDQVVLKDYAEQLTETVNSQMGILTYPLALVIRFITEVMALTPSECILTMPRMAYKGYVLYEGSNFNFTEYVHESQFADLYNIYLKFTDFVMIIAVMLLAMKKGEEIIRGN